MSHDTRRFAPATERNREAIAEVLATVLPPSGTVLEIAAGTGEHACFFAARFSQLVWQPSDPDAGARASIAAWREHAALSNLRAPLALDVCAPPASWPLARADALVCINMTHISPWAATLGLFAGASALLGAGAPLYIYGPFNLDGKFTAPSNARFDAYLRGEDARWGLRDVDALRRAGDDAGLSFEQRVAMPANNQSLVFRRSAG